MIVSSIGADRPEQADEQMRPYVEAKAEADRALERSGLDYTIVRPGRLTDDPGNGPCARGADVGHGSVARDDVAATLLAVLEADNTIGKAFDLFEGDTPIDEAVRSL